MAEFLRALPARARAFAQRFASDEDLRQQARKPLLAMALLTLATSLIIPIRILSGGADLEPTARMSQADTSPSPTASPRPTPTPTPETHPGVRSSRTKISPPFQQRIDRAIAAARKEGVTLRINSGWRSPERQQALYRQAVRQYGSARIARRWVLPAPESEHPNGRAVDIGPPSSAAWLDRNGYRFGICRRYKSEPWHFEPLTLPGEPCPPMEKMPG